MGCARGGDDEAEGEQRDAGPRGLAQGGDAAVEPPVDAVANAEVADGLGVEQDVGVDLSCGGGGGGEADQGERGLVAGAGLRDRKDQSEERGTDPELELCHLNGAVLLEERDAAGEHDQGDCGGDEDRRDERGAQKIVRSVPVERHGRDIGVVHS